VRKKKLTTKFLMKMKRVALRTITVSVAAVKTLTLIFQIDAVAATHASASVT
jgi:hypothetical protein